MTQADVGGVCAQGALSPYLFGFGAPAVKGAWLFSKPPFVPMKTVSGHTLFDSEQAPGGVWVSAVV